MKKVFTSLAIAVGLILTRSSYEHVQESAAITSQDNQTPPAAAPAVSAQNCDGRRASAVLPQSGCSYQNTCSAGFGRSQKAGSFRNEFCPGEGLLAVDAEIAPPIPCGEPDGLVGRIGRPARFLSLEANGSALQWFRIGGHHA